MTHYDSVHQFLDRCGCGDELYMNARFRSSLLLEEISGAGALGDGEGQADDETFDEAAHH